jgi:hypothetical protein
VRGVHTGQGSELGEGVHLGQGSELGEYTLLRRMSQEVPIDFV